MKKKWISSNILINHLKKMASMSIPTEIVDASTEQFVSSTEKFNSVELRWENFTSHLIKLITNYSNMAFNTLLSGVEFSLTI